MSARILAFPGQPAPSVGIPVSRGQAVLFQGTRHTVEQVYDTRALIAGPRGQRIARLAYLTLSAPANR
ncbi:MAG: hypothetical protein E6Q98_19880 [Rhodospirillaceae bacterium]|nr:MAG: hypothetical protein E6Q98_19880 [Rhodospirillaceae bacterium]